MTIDYAARRARIAPALGLTADEILLAGAGHPIPKPEISDALLPFIAHQEYYYLTGHAEADGGILAYDPKSGWTSFVPEVTELDRVWEGKAQLPGELLAKFPAWLAARQGRKVVALGAPVPGVASDEQRTAGVREAYKHARRPKEPGEIDLMKRGAAAAAAGYAKIQPLLKPGVSERTLQIELEAEFFRHGAQTTGYDSIVGVGAQSAVFHGSPSPDRRAKDGDFILIDAGPQTDRYVIDVTRTYVAGKPSAFQRDFAQAVLGAQVRACELGVEQPCAHQVRVAQVGVAQVGFAEVRLAEPLALKFQVVQRRLHERRQREVHLGEGDRPQHAVDEVRTHEAARVEGRPRQHGAVEGALPERRRVVFRLTEIRPGEVAPGERAPRRDELAEIGFGEVAVGERPLLPVLIGQVRVGVILADLFDRVVHSHTLPLSTCW